MSSWKNIEIETARALSAVRDAEKALANAREAYWCLPITITAIPTVSFELFIVEFEFNVAISWESAREKIIGVGLIPATKEQLRSVYIQVAEKPVVSGTEDVAWCSRQVHSGRGCYHNSIDDSDIQRLWKNVRYLAADPKAG